MKTIILTLTTLFIPLMFNFTKWINYNNYEVSDSDFVTEYENEKVTIKSNND